MPSCLPQAERVLADRGYDADWFREALKDKGIKACIPGPGGQEDIHQARQAPLQASQPYRDDVRQAQRLEVCCNPMRQVPATFFAPIMRAATVLSCLGARTRPDPH